MVPPALSMPRRPLPPGLSALSAMGGIPPPASVLAVTPATASKAAELGDVGGDRYADEYWVVLDTCDNARGDENRALLVLVSTCSVLPVVVEAVVADDGEGGGAEEGDRRNHQGGAASALFTPHPWIEVGPDQVARLGRIGHRLTRRSRDLYPAPNRTPRALLAGSSPSADRRGHSAGEPEKR